jgi:hypothetical protein
MQRNHLIWKTKSPILLKWSNSLKVDYTVCYCSQKLCYFRRGGSPGRLAKILKTFIHELVHGLHGFSRIYYLLFAASLRYVLFYLNELLSRGLPLGSAFISPVVCISTDTPSIVCPILFLYFSVFFFYRYNNS